MEAAELRPDQAVPPRDPLLVRSVRRPVGARLAGARYDDFNLFSAKKVEEKLVYMHQDPVRAGLAAQACDWPWSSARYYEQGRTVGVPVGWLD